MRYSTLLLTILPLVLSAPVAFESMILSSQIRDFRISRAYSDIDEARSITKFGVEEYDADTASTEKRDAATGIKSFAAEDYDADTIVGNDKAKRSAESSAQKSGMFIVGQYDADTVSNNEEA